VGCRESACVPRGATAPTEGWSLVCDFKTAIIGLIFFEETVNTQVYMNIFNMFVNQLDDEELQCGFFQQDGETCRMSNDSIAETEFLFRTESSPGDCGHQYHLS
jgi:hypothetical protein